MPYADRAMPLVIVTIRPAANDVARECDASGELPSAARLLVSYELAVIIAENTAATSSMIAEMPPSFISRHDIATARGGKMRFTAPDAILPAMLPAAFP